MTTDQDHGDRNALFLSFVAPCYNEAANIEGAVKEIEHIARDCAIENYEIILVDDASEDATGAIMARLAKEKPLVKHVANPRNLGFGGAYKTGLKHAAGKYVIMVPGDNNHPAGGVAPIIKMAGQADIIIPYVTNPGVRGRRRRFISTSFTKLINFLFGLDVPYYNGLVLHKTELLGQITIETNGFAYQAEAIVKLLKRGASYTTLGVELKDSDPATSAFKLKNIVRVLKTIITLLLRP